MEKTQGELARALSPRCPCCHHIARPNSQSAVQCRVKYCECRAIEHDFRSAAAIQNGYWLKEEIK